MYARSALAANRDFRDPDSGQFVCGFNPKARPTMGARGPRPTKRANPGRPSIMPAIPRLGLGNQLISPDDPGAMREVIERDFAPCVFLQGASGDLGPREGFSGDPAARRSQRTAARIYLARWNPFLRQGHDTSIPVPSFRATLGSGSISRCLWTVSPRQARGVDATVNLPIDLNFPQTMRSGRRVRFRPRCDRPRKRATTR